MKILRFAQDDLLYAHFQLPKLPQSAALSLPSGDRNTPRIAAFMTARGLA